MNNYFKKNVLAFKKVSIFVPDLVSRVFFLKININKAVLLGMVKGAQYLIQNFLYSFYI